MLLEVETEVEQRIAQDAFGAEEQRNQKAAELSEPNRPIAARCARRIDGEQCAALGPERSHAGRHAIAIDRIFTVNKRDALRVSQVWTRFRIAAMVATNLR
jgi:hypothetical protein